jgi:hypothetical protein
MSLNTRYSRSVNPSGFALVTPQQALFTDNQIMQNFYGAADGQIALFAEQANGLYRTETNDVTNLNQQIFLAQKSTVTRNGKTSAVIKKSQRFKLNDVTIHRKASQLAVKPTVIVGAIPVPATGGNYSLTITDLSRLTFKFPRFTFSISVKPSQLTGTPATDKAYIAGRFVTWINDPTNPMWQTQGQIYVASLSANGQGIVIAPIYDNESFVVSVSDVMADAVVTVAPGTAEGSTAVQAVFSWGNDQETLGAEKDSKSSDGYDWQNTIQWFNDFPTPEMFTQTGCFYTCYVISGKQLATRTIPQRTAYDNINIAIYVKEAAPQTREDAIFNTVFTTKGIVNK